MPQIADHRTGSAGTSKVTEASSRSARQVCHAFTTEKAAVREEPNRASSIAGKMDIQPSPRLRKDALHELAMDIGKTIIAALESIGQSRVVHSE